MASSSVPITLGLAGLSNPMWLSLICRKVSLLGWAASAPSMIPSESGTPPEIVHSTPVPAQVMHSNTFRRLTPAFLSLFVEALMVVLRDSSAYLMVTGPRRDLFPGSRKSEDLNAHPEILRQMRRASEIGHRIAACAPRAAKPPMLRMASPRSGRQAGRCARSFRRLHGNVRDDAG